MEGELININLNLTIIGTLKSANLAIGTNLKSKKKDDKPYESEKGSKEELDIINANSDLYIDFNIPWMLALITKLIMQDLSPNN